MNQSFMKEKAVFPMVFSMSIPMVLSMLVNSLYNIVDSYFVAKISEDAMTRFPLFIRSKFWSWRRRWLWHRHQCRGVLLPWQERIGSGQQRRFFRPAVKRFARCFPDNCVYPGIALFSSAFLSERGRHLLWARLFLYRVCLLRSYHNRNCF